MKTGQKYVYIDGKRYTPFEIQWGMSIEDIADIEQTTTEAIRMRVLRFGTPFQRRAKPSRAEILWGKTVWQFANELGVTHVTVHKRIATGRAPWDKNDHHNCGRRRGGKPSKGIAPSKSGWLMPQHPDYHTWRDNYEPAL